jgi:hypothetical protein
MSNNKEINGESLDFIFKQVGYIFASGSLMISGPIIAKYAPKMFPSFTFLNVFSAISGLFLVFLGLYLVITVGIYGAQEINKRYKSTIKGKLYGVLYAFMAFQIVMAGYMAATEKVAEKPQYNKPLKQDK